MNKSALLLALSLVLAFGGCDFRDEDITDTITKGTWRVSYFIASRDEHTALFSGYVFTFQTNGTVTVVRPDAPPATGTWNEYDYNRRFELSFGKAGLLEKLNESWVVDDVRENELLLHEPGAPFNQFELRKN